MIVVKAKLITSGADDLAAFINNNNIKGVDILSITSAVTGGGTNLKYTILYYAEE